MVASGNDTNKVRHDEADESDYADGRYGKGGCESRGRENQIAKSFDRQADDRRLQLTARQNVQVSGRGGTAD